MFKDRKFWAGLFMGGLLGASVMVIQPTNAAAPDVMSSIAKVMVSIVKNQKETNKELAEIKRNTTIMNQHLSNLSKSQGINTGNNR